MKTQKTNAVKVLHVVGQMNRGGTEALLMNLLRCTDRGQFQYDFVEQTQGKCDYDEEIEALGGKIFRCPTISLRNLHTYRLWWRNFFREHPEYRIVHGHSRGSAPIYFAEAKKAGCITIAHCHNNSFGLGLKGFVRKVWQTPLRTIADYNFACSYESGVSQYGAKGKFTVIKNGILAEKYRWNPETRECLRQKMGIEDSLVIGNVARFEEQKNHKFLIEIFYELQKIRPDAKLMLVGRGTLENEIRAQVRSLHLEDKVIFMGLRSDVYDLLQAMDIFLLPSHFEGLPVSMIEAQASGIVCVVSDTVKAPEAKVTDLIYSISLQNTAKQWAEEILKIYSQHGDRRDTYEEIVSSGFDIHSTAEWLQNFYLNIEGDK